MRNVLTPGYLLQGTSGLGSDDGTVRTGTLVYQGYAPAVNTGHVTQITGVGSLTTSGKTATIHAGASFAPGATSLTTTGYAPTITTTASALRDYVQTLDNMTLLIDPRAGGSTITESGGKVTDIENLGSAGDFDQSDSAEQATLVSEKLVFNRSFYNITGTLELRTVFMVLEIDSADSTNVMFSDLTNGQYELNTSNGTVYDTDSGTLIGADHMINGAVDDAVPDDTLHVVHGERPTSSYSYGSGNFALGRLHPVHSARDFIGDLHFFVGFSDTLTTGETDQILADIETEFGITIA